MCDCEILYEFVCCVVVVGFDMLQFMVDIFVVGVCLCDKCNGFSILLQLILGMIINVILCLWWWYDFFIILKLEFVFFSMIGGIVGELLDVVMDLIISYDDFVVICDIWFGKIVIKGVQNVEDFVCLCDVGVDGIVFFNYGGCQFDCVLILFYLLFEVCQVVGDDFMVMIDIGIMNGVDIVVVVVFGVDFMLIGCVYLYGLMVGGCQGVDWMIVILCSEIECIM